MVIGNGQIANKFKQNNFENNIVVFASGVSNSNCTSSKEFEREEKLLKYVLEENKDKKFIYFSSCALSVNNYDLNAYYKHKLYMESLIKKNSDNYYIFRVPQLFGDLKSHNTIINFFYNCILNNTSFHIYDDSYRYVIELNDVYKIVNYIVSTQSSKLTLDIANPYRYQVVEIVKILEKLLSKNANYTFIKKSDKYTLNLNNFNQFINEGEFEIKNLGQEYLYVKLKENLLRIKS